MLNSYAQVVIFVLEFLEINYNGMEYSLLLILNNSFENNYMYKT